MGDESADDDAIAGGLFVSSRRGEEGEYEERLEMRTPLART